MLYDHGFETEKTTIKSKVKHNPGNKKILEGSNVVVGEGRCS